MFDSTTRRVSEKQLVRLQALYKECFGVNLTLDEAADAARRLVTLFCPLNDEIHTLRPEK